MTNITGTANPDFLTGTIAADLITGLGSDDYLIGADGNDTLQGGTGDDTVSGGSDADIVDGGSGDDLLYGGSGNDTLIGGAGEDFFFGQSGTDTASYGTALVGLTLNMTNTALSTGDAAGDIFSAMERYVLSGFADAFVGSVAGEYVQGGAGDDTLQGLMGDDSLQGGDGNDVLMGGAGGDILNGGIGIDIISYRDAVDRIDFDLVTDFFSGDAQDDVFIGFEQVEGSIYGDRILLAGDFHMADGGAGGDLIFGTDQADTLIGGTGEDVLSGGAGNDLLEAGDDGDMLDGFLETKVMAGEDGDDVINGGTAKDNAFGGSGNDTLRGAAGSDVLFGDDGNDQIFGGADDDQIDGGAGADQINGGDGLDTVIYATDVKVSFAAGVASTGAAAGDTFAKIEAIQFNSAGNSIYVGGEANMRVMANGGHLTAFAGAGAEEFFGAGSFDVSYSRASAAVTLTANGFQGLTGSRAAQGDEIEGASGVTLTRYADRVNLVPGTVVSLGNIYAGSGNDKVTGGVGTVQIDLGNGKDTANLTVGAGLGAASATVSGGAGNDRITATNFEAITFVGGTGNDTLIGGDTLAGAANSGTLDGGDGNDTVTLFASTATITGGAGDDSVTFTLFTNGISPLSFIDCGAGNDTLTLSMMIATDRLDGSAISVIGGAGDDTVFGFDNDQFGIDTDSMPEHFIFDAGWGHDVIHNFELTSVFYPLFQDKLQFRGTAGVGLDSFADLTITGDATHTLVTFGSDSIDLIGVNVASFTATNVEFI